ncbi:hypothetical protein [Kamptonema formosum]|nr:hypothetical protein [Oscillatoria sp. PCC 10802]
MACWLQPAMGRYFVEMASELFYPAPDLFSDTPPALSAKSQLEAFCRS